MIRRKLTRIEVTLDDTKELDDFFSSKTTTNTPNTQQASNKLAVQLQPPTVPQTDNSTTNETTGGADTNRLGFNPQPYNPPSRFQINNSQQDL